MIHPTALIAPNAQLHPTVSVGPYSIIGEDVQIGEGTHIGSSVVIEGKVRLGKKNQVGHGSIIGGFPQHLAYTRQQSSVWIGDENIIREHVIIHRGLKDGSETRIGSYNYLMGQTHIAHDCHVGNHIILTHSSLLAGHCVVEDYANIGGMVGVHQFVRVGSYAMIGGLSRIVQDVPPFMICEGNPAQLFGLNKIGLKRANFSSDDLSQLKRAYQILFLKKGPLLQEALKLCEKEFTSPRVKQLLNFMIPSKKGILRRTS